MATQRHGVASPREIDDLLQKCIQALPPAQQDPVIPKRSGLHVVLTGSTGWIGQHFLMALIRNSDIAKVTCIDRKPDAISKLEPMLALAPEHRRKVACLQGQIDKPNLGLSDAGLRSLDNVDAFVANAWPVNYAIPLSAFEKHVLGLARHLCSWAASVPSRPRLVFVSSFAAVDSYRKVRSGLVPEAVVDDARICNGDGYTASKNIAERTLLAAAKRANIPSTILRIGGASGPISVPEHIPTVARERFVWNRREWVYMNLVTARNLGAIVRYGPSVNWIPVDLMSAAMLELIVHDLAHSPLLTVYNVTNRPVTWESLTDTIMEHVFSKKHPGRILEDPKESFELLRAFDPANPEHIRLYPSIQILPMMARLLQDGKMGKDAVHAETLEKTATKAASPTMRELQPMNKDWFKHYLTMWGFKGDDTDDSAFTPRSNL